MERTQQLAFLHPFTGVDAPPDPPVQLPLWLSGEEAEMLVSLCLTSLTSAGEAEHGLFVKLGDYLRAFER